LAGPSLVRPSPLRLVASCSGHVERDELIHGRDTIPYIENRAVLALSAGHYERAHTKAHVRAVVGTGYLNAVL